MVLHPVVRVSAKLRDRNPHITVNGRSTVHAHFLDVLKLLGTNEDLLLWNLHNAAIEIFEEEAVHLKHIFLDLEQLDQVDVLRLAILVLDATLLRHDDEVLFLCSCNHPLDVLETDLMIHRNEESLIVS